MTSTDIDQPLEPDATASRWAEHETKAMDALADVAAGAEDPGGLRVRAAQAVLQHIRDDRERFVECAKKAHMENLAALFGTDPLAATDTPFADVDG